MCARCTSTPLNGYSADECLLLGDVASLLLFLFVSLAQNNFLKTKNKFEQNAGCFHKNYLLQNQIFKWKAVHFLLCSYNYNSVCLHKFISKVRKNWKNADTKIFFVFFCIIKRLSRIQDYISIIIGPLTISC